MYYNQNGSEDDMFGYTGPTYGSPEYIRMVENERMMREELERKEAEEKKEEDRLREELRVLEELHLECWNRLDRMLRNGMQRENREKWTLIAWDTLSEEHLGVLKDRIRDLDKDNRRITRKSMDRIYGEVHEAIQRIEKEGKDTLISALFFNERGSEFSEMEFEKRMDKGAMDQQLLDAYNGDDFMETFKSKPMDTRGNVAFAGLATLMKK